MGSDSIKNLYIDQTRSKGSRKDWNQNTVQKPIWDEFLPLPWPFWPSETRLLLGLIVFWSLAGIFVLGSASWWVAIREMGDGAYYIKRQLIWLIASSSLAWLAISTNLRS